jgi:ribosomal protein L16/L10AE
MKVRVVEQGGIMADVEVSENATIETALRKAGARIDVAKEIRVNNEVAELEDTLDPNDTIFVIPQVKGN